MSHASSRTRWSVPPPEAPWDRLRRILADRQTWMHIGVCGLAVMALWVMTRGWSPAFPYRERIAPMRTVCARVEFEYADLEGTIRARERARRDVLVYYRNDYNAMQDLRDALIDRLFNIQTGTVEQVDMKIWKEFQSPDLDDDTEAPTRSLEAFREALADDKSLEKLRSAIQVVFEPLIRDGLIESLKHEMGQGRRNEILVYPINNIEDERRVHVSSVRIAEVRPVLESRFVMEISKHASTIGDPELVARRIMAWLEPRLKPTLTYDERASEEARVRAEQNVPAVQKKFLAGQPLERPDMLENKVKLIAAGQPLTAPDIHLLRAEHRAYVDALSTQQRLVYSLSHLGMYAGVFALLSFYLAYREPGIFRNLGLFSGVIAAVSITLLLAWALAIDVTWRSEIIPVLLLVMITSITYNRELAMLIGCLVAMIFAMTHGYGLTEFVILAGAATTTSLLCGRIRSRTRLVYVGVVAALVVLPTVVVASQIQGQPLTLDLWVDAVWYAAGAMLTGLLMTAFLPFLEKWFGVQTDISLLELSDASHPLLRQLVQRAPGTYNHSINVASIAEAAADKIGGNGLLCRVGAYFHDIGKMRKPDYFVENQSGDNKHDDLVPTMSTLVIIAHVKDGAEMARKHHLPSRIIDLIEQHHGTTLVEYFYRQASLQLERQKADGEDGNSHGLEESTFRYPGPKPQTLEAAVMMLADAVESACRTIREPTPARIENLVDQILQNKLQDEQFDECPVTLKQLNTIQDSLIKSLNAMYHARVKYPGQRPA